MFSGIRNQEAGSWMLDLKFLREYYRGRGCTCRNMRRVIEGGRHSRACPLFERRVSGVVK